MDSDFSVVCIFQKHPYITHVCGVFEKCNRWKKMSPDWQGFYETLYLGAKRGTDKC